MRIFGIPVIYHYVQFRYYFASMVLFFVKKIPYEENGNKIIKLLIAKHAIWQCGVLVKTLDWKISNDKELLAKARGEK